MPVFTLGSRWFELVSGGYVTARAMPCRKYLQISYEHFITFTFDLKYQGQELETPQVLVGHLGAGPGGYIRLTRDLENTAPH